MPKKVNLSRNKVLKAIDGSAGVMLTVSKKCGVAYDTIWRYFNNPKNTDMKALLEKEREKIIDVAENKLYKKVQEEDSWAIKYVLSTIGAKRGFTEKHQIEHNINKIEVQRLEPVNDRVIDVNNEYIEDKDKTD